MWWMRFPDWMVSRKTANTLPAQQRVMALLSLAGPSGMSYSGLARMTKLPPRELRTLLNALVGGGELAASRRTDGVPMYRRLI